MRGFTSSFFSYRKYRGFTFILKNILGGCMAQHQNVFLTALSCQGTFITF